MSYETDREWQQCRRELLRDHYKGEDSTAKTVRSIALVRRMYEIETMSPQTLQWRAEHPESSDDAIAESELIIARAEAQKAIAAYLAECGYSLNAAATIAKMSDERLFREAAAVTGAEL